MSDRAVKAMAPAFSRAVTMSVISGSFLDNENRATSETGTFHGASPPRLDVSAREPPLELGSLLEPSINPQGATSAMID